VRPQLIDDLTRRDHFFLGSDEVCYYFGEYAARHGRPFGPTNELIHQLLQPVNQSGPGPDIRKERAIRHCARMLKAAFEPDQLQAITFVPLPLVRGREHPAHDNRLRRMLRSTAEGIDVRELIEFVPSRESAEAIAMRAGPDVLYASMRIVPGLLEPRPRAIFLVSDVLATGAQFVAAKRHLAHCLPDVPVSGLFIARKLLDSDPIPNFDGL
jgi:hypothetical protein